jgi:uncharacterized protein (DUF2141 family)
MPRRFIAVSLAVVVLGLASTVAFADEPEEGAAVGAELTVEVLGLESDEGTVMTALFDSQEAYDGPADPVRMARVDIDGKQARVSWAGLPPGEYALRIVHDRNANGEIDTNWVGIPTEPFGFSNDPVSRFGPPDFDAAKFSLDSEGLTVQVTLKEI